MFNSYQPVDLQSNKLTSQSRAHQNVWQGRNDFASDVNPKIDISRPVTEKKFTDGHGRQCRIICEPKRLQPQDLTRIANSLLGKNIHQAEQIYPDVREVIHNGIQLIVVQNFNFHRINVETKNDIIIRIIGFY
jgi:hypothetical protein